MTQKRIFILAALAVLSVGETSFLMGQAAPTVVKRATANTSQVGRYLIVINPNVRADTFLLDTQTGKSWVATHVTDVEGDPTVWLFRQQVDNDQDFADWFRHQIPKKKE